MAKIEGYWDCPYCGNKAIRGRYQTCPGCGKTRSSNTKFYMLDHEPVADESNIESGPDWFCPYCDSYNPHSVAVCKNCGHPRDESDKDYFEERREQDQRQREREQEYEQVVHASANTHPAGGVHHTETLYINHTATKAKRNRSIPTKRFVAIFLLLALLLSGIFLLLPHEKSVTILDKSWERNVQVEQYRLVEDDGWSLPSDAIELLRTAREIHHYDQVLDHYETVTEQKSRQVQDGYDTYTTYNDLGNGYFESVEHQTPRYRTEYYTETHEEPVYRSVPVYQTKYYYTIWRWVYDRTETTSGTVDPYWTEIQYADDEREGAKSESYVVECETSKGKTVSYVCDLDIWSGLDIGQQYTVKTQTGRIIEIR